jgi:hypothetical protein
VREARVLPSHIIYLLGNLKEYVTSVFANTQLETVFSIPILARADGACVKTCQQRSKLQQKKDAESFKLTSVKRVYSGFPWLK